MNIQVVYSDKQNADTGKQPGVEVESPSARKPKLVAEHLRLQPDLDLTFVDPIPLTTKDFLRSHGKEFVEDVLALRRSNGFGTKSQSVVDSLPYTNGAMYTAAKLATADKPTCALVSGFHHAAWESYLGYFCTFNGLTIAGQKLIEEDKYERIAIIDCDYHYGNGTEDILYCLQAKRNAYYHETFGFRFRKREQAKAYLNHFDSVRQSLEYFKPNVILYQAGADCHINDPYGGLLTELEMFSRDLKMFKIAKELQIPITWNLAGGYQVAPDGSIDPVLRMHYNTFKACRNVYQS